MSCWDTSALAKLYLPEPDSGAFRSLAIQLAPVSTAHLTRHEIRTVFRRREAEGVIVPGAAALLNGDFENDIASGIVAIQDETDVVRQEFADTLELCLSASPTVFVRTNDALHIASAKASGQNQFISADLRQWAIPAQDPPHTRWCVTQVANLCHANFAGIWTSITTDGSPSGLLDGGQAALR